ncbi:MAG: hypothetical protein HYV29_02075 [Ignavibacteriales bacterium]|nr:hypothetical protein [Ignavibacteriales bacterium]
MTSTQKFTVLSVTAFGLFIPNGMFFYYLFVQFQSPMDVMNDLLALAFIIDAFMATGLLAWYFARNPLGKHSWKLFVALSLLGGLGFSIPFFYYLNKR